MNVGRHVTCHSRILSFSTSPLLTYHSFVLSWPPWMVAHVMQHPSNFEDLNSKCKMTTSSHSINQEAVPSSRISDAAFEYRCAEATTLHPTFSGIDFIGIRPKINQVINQRILLWCRVFECQSWTERSPLCRCRSLNIGLFSFSYEEDSGSLFS